MKSSSLVSNLCLSAMLIGCLLVAQPAAAQLGAAQSGARADRSSNSGQLAVLVRNSDTSRGAPPYALADAYGRVQRLVEPSAGVDLSGYVGTRVRVKNDTGMTLLSSQLDLPTQVKTLQFTSPSKNRQRRVSQASHAVQTARYDEAAEAIEDATKPILTDAIDLDELLPPPSEEVNATENESDTDGFSTGTDDTMSADEGHLLPEPITPIVIEELPLTEPMMEVQRSHADDCPHCQAKANSYRTEASHECASCRTKQPFCKSCQKCRTCAGPSCSPASQSGVYGRAEYTLWWFDGMNTPPLVTSGTTTSEAVLGREGTQVLFGGNLLDDPRSGLRFTLGAWLDNDRDIAIEADWHFMETESVGFSAGDLTGASVIGRPFYNLSPTDTDGITILPPAEDAELVSYPGLISGTVGVSARSQFESFGVRLRTGICCREIGGCNSGCGSCNSGCNSCGPQYGGDASAISRIDFTFGYRYTDLDELLTINENLTSLQTNNPGTFAITDQFDTDNEFHGVDLGFISEWENRRWAVELSSRIALGSTRQRVRINGSTTTSNGTTSFDSSGGLLALDSNIGTYKRSRFGVLPELSARLAYKVSPDLRLSVAYSLMYWANVVRPGDQIDLSIDPSFIPPASGTPTSSSHPQFNFHETGLWAHGLNFGLDYSY